MQYSTTNNQNLRPELLGFVSVRDAASFFNPLRDFVVRINAINMTAIGRGLTANKKIQRDFQKAMMDDSWFKLIDTDWLIGAGSPAESLMKALKEAEKRLAELQIVFSKLDDGTLDKESKEKGLTGSEVVQHLLNKIAEEVIEPLDRKLTHVPWELFVSEIKNVADTFGIEVTDK